MFLGVSSFRQHGASRRKVIQAVVSSHNHAKDAKTGCKTNLSGNESRENIGVGW
jgi:hypothetical protein